MLWLLAAGSLAAPGFEWVIEMAERDASDVLSSREIRREPARGLRPKPGLRVWTKSLRVSAEQRAIRTKNG